MSIGILYICARRRVFRITDNKICCLVVFLFFFKFGLAGKLDAEFAELPDVYGREHDRSMRLTAFQ